jgi:hypothetical protein
VNGNRMRLLAVLSLLFIFIAGGLVGAAVERGRHHGPRDDRPPREGRRGGPPPMFAEGSPLAERLKLTPAQRDSIEKLTARDRTRADSVFRETRRGMRAHFDSTMQAVAAVLTPEQRAEWQKIRQEWTERDQREGRGRRGQGRGGRGGDDPPGMPPPGPLPPPESADGPPART